jgi:hypothetical protein
MNIENLTRRPLRAAGLALALGLATLTLASCGGEDDATQGQQPSATETTNAPGVEHTYYDDGSRHTDYKDEAGDYSDVWAYCDGPDMVEQTAYNGGYKAAAGNALTRSVGHPACTDGELTVADFRTQG